jgi:hypothetical protein
MSDGKSKDDRIPGDEPSGMAARPALVAALNERVVTPSLRSAPAEIQCYDDVPSQQSAGDRLPAPFAPTACTTRTNRPCEDAHQAGMMCEDWQRC